MVEMLLVWPLPQGQKNLEVQDSVEMISSSEQREHAKRLKHEYSWMTFCGRKTYTSILERKYTSTYRTLTQQHSHILQSKQLQNPPLFQVKDTLCKSQSSLKGPLYPEHGRTWDCLCSLSTPEVSLKPNGCIHETMP